MRASVGLLFASLMYSRILQSTSKEQTCICFAGRPALVVTGLFVIRRSPRAHSKNTKSLPRAPLRVFTGHLGTCLKGPLDPQDSQVPAPKSLLISSVARLPQSHCKFQKELNKKLLISRLMRPNIDLIPLSSQYRHNATMLCT